MEEVQEDRYSWKYKTIKNYWLAGSFSLRTARRLGEAYAEFPFEYDELMVHMSNKIKLLDVSIARNSRFLGRIYNRITGEELDFVQLDGMVVKQIYDFIGEDPPMPINLNSKYRVAHEELRTWYELAADAKSICTNCGSA